MSVKTSIFCALVACLPLVSQAEPYFTNKEGNLIWDKATNLVWQRCSVGETWDGNNCTGQMQRFTFDQARGFDGWRVPTSRELGSLIYCSSGKRSNWVDLGDGGSARVGFECDGSYSKPTIKTIAFPNTKWGWYWTSSLAKWGNGSHAVTISFGNGNIDISERSNTLPVRLVRAIHTLGGEVALDFPTSIDELERIAQAKRQEEERIAEAKRQVEERRVKAQRSAAERSLIAGGAQDLYLKAGKAQRGGSVSVDGVSFYASELYEMIVEKFPKSEYAVKASDQLTAMSRSESAARAARAGEERRRQQQSNQNNASRQQCQAQKQTCFASCPPYRSVSSSENSLIVNSAHFDCKSRCESISCY